MQFSMDRVLPLPINIKLVVETVVKFYYSVFEIGCVSVITYEQVNLESYSYPYSYYMLSELKFQ